jgi:nucleoside 2-deoxyribosyltransferase
MAVMPNRDALHQATLGQSEGLSEPYLAYLAGGLFTQHDLASNVSMKEAVWRLSNGRFAVVLPQSKELRQLDQQDLAAHLRNLDLLELIRADILIARFDGPEIDAGTVVEFMLAKMLGKPAVIVRTDSRHIATDGLDDPYNLMLKSWPRTAVVHIDSVIDYVQMMAASREELCDTQSVELLLEAELAIVNRGMDAVASKLIDAMEAVIGMESPYPPELRTVVYEAARYAPGCGFHQLLSRQRLEPILQRLVERNTL